MLTLIATLAALGATTSGAFFCYVSWSVWRQDDMPSAILAAGTAAGCFAIAFGCLWLGWAL
ncbi:MAG: hypothetical protein MUE98_00030 [Rhodobacteraceae bacterium]|jgi:hypothetical protein|nr:hypothetical protein [Paracoccaceae bacterium]